MLRYFLKMPSVRWAFNLAEWRPTESDVLLASACVQPEEKERLARFVFKRDFESSLVGRLMMRKFVADFAGLGYDEVKFGRDERGKPVLLNDGYPKVAFNVSHQGGYVVLAGETDGKVVGVDVMKLEYTGGKSIGEFFRIMTRNFSSDEWVAIKGGSNDQERISTFCRHWCLKESYVKAIGVGITVDLRDISFKLAGRDLYLDKLVTSTELFVRGEKQPWIFEEMKLGEQHCVAVALNRPNESETVFREINFPELVAAAVPLLEYDREYCASYFKKLEK